MWTDSESDVDYLNYSEVSEMICEMISDDAMLPISLGVYGTWGVGKSSILKLVHKGLEPDERNLIITFDAWLYQDFDEAKAALMTVIAKAFYEQCSESLQEKAASFYRRVNKLKTLGLLADASAFAFGLPTFGTFTRAGSAVEDMWEGKSDERDVEAVKYAAKEAKDTVAGLLKPKERRNAPEEISAFRDEFEKLLGSMERRLIVFVDNLDRCLPSNAISTLEAMRLFLFLPNTAFVVAADEDMIRLAVARHFSDPGDQHVTDYLDKLIQVPIRVPKLGLQEVRAYLVMLAVVSSKEVSKPRSDEVREYLINKLRRSWSDEPSFKIEEVTAKLGLTSNSELPGALKTFDRLASLLAHSVRVNGNPRVVKRMLNVIRMRSKTAKLRGMSLSEAVIAKLALFERCTSEEAIRDFAFMVNASSEGKPVVLAELEALEEGSLVQEKLPKNWQKHMDFIADWLLLEPTLGDLDLRPAVYLSRETLPLRAISTKLSAAAKQALEILAKTATINSKASRDAIAELGDGEAALVMEELVAGMSRNPDWSKVRRDFRGAVLLARSDGAAHEKLVQFVLNIPNKPAWMTSLMKDDAAEGST